MHLLIGEASEMHLLIGEDSDMNPQMEKGPQHEVRLLVRLVCLH